ncbi:MAG: energy transducer TonB [Myxococcales bacterium]|nr:energy transducer TonB [Myxococcales bacterium]
MVAFVLLGAAGPASVARAQSEGPASAPDRMGDDRPPPPASARPSLGRPLPPLLLAQIAGWILPPEPEPDDPQTRARRALEQWLHDRLEADRIATVGVDGWYHVVARTIRSQHRPDVQAARRERRLGMSDWERLLDDLRTHSVPPEVPPGPAPPPEEMTGLGARLDAAERAQARFEEQTGLLASGPRWHATEVRAIYDPEGDLAAAWVERSSGSDVLDEAALEAVRAVDGTAGPPPARVVADRHAISALWRIEAGEVPVRWGRAGCVDDPVRGGWQCAGPGGALVRSRVRLIAVDDGTRRRLPAWPGELRERDGAAR